MGASKIINYSEEELLIAKFAKALSHPARVAIIKLLLQKQSCVCGDIVEDLPIAQSTVSQHLKELKEAGLIKGNIDGASICYCVDTDVLQKANDILNKVLGASIQTQTTCC
ncbi:MAG: winged helix-turn-helix transcriptional regulator [Sediminibacterium sp.]|jgi:DNA-binding transcriptional ArsR family regulator|nr:winged helix-turn-helix transcriptional regulator [Sediminibacterium sp.]